MSEQRQKRRDLQAAKDNPQNVTIIDNGIRKVISWEEYQDYLNEGVK